MEISYGSAKDRRNAQERGLSFTRARDFDFETALYDIDTRQDYGETRIKAFGFLDGRLHALVFTETFTGIRIISLRKANSREIRRYEKTTQD